MKYRTALGFIWDRLVQNSSDMGRKCCVVGCKSNYLSTKEYIPVYTFPADKEECARWVAALPFQINNIIVHIVVCRKHWPEHTQMKKIKRYLRPAAAPSLFANSTPAMFIENQPTPSRNILKRKLSLVDRNAQPDELSAFNSIDIIPNWPALKISTILTSSLLIIFTSKDTWIV